MPNEEALKGLEPQVLWKYFGEICSVPHGSKSETALKARLSKLIKEKGLKPREDAIGNLIVEVPSSPGKEKAPIVIVQAHLDMVCEKNKSVAHNFDKDPIKLVRDGEWLKAKETTLGADNGIGVAAALALLEEKKFSHGPLEFLFTIDEESGMTGAFNLDPNELKGRILLNLDSEEPGHIYVGCAGGASGTISLPLQWEKSNKEDIGIKVTVTGLRGGHSGTEIHLGRGNAIKFLARILNEGKKLGLSICALEGGNKHNAIPREASAICVINAGQVEKFKKIAAEKKAEFASELDPGHELEITVEKVDTPEKIVTVDSSQKALNLLIGLPSGVLAMSRQIPGLVETSCSLAIARIDEKGLWCLANARSSVSSAMRAVLEQVVAIGQNAGAMVNIGDSYPGWQPNMESEALKVVRKCHKETFGKEAVISAIHAGLECGVIGGRVPGIDMVSFGPDIRNPHSPDEMVNIKSVEDFYKLLLAVLRKFAE